MGRGGGAIDRRLNAHPRRVHGWDEVAAALDRQADLFDSGESDSSIRVSTCARIVLAEAAALAVGEMKADLEDYRDGEPFEDLYRFRLMLPPAFSESYTPELMQRFVDLVRPTATKLTGWPQVGPLTIAERLVASDLIGSAAYLAEHSVLPVSDADKPADPDAVAEELCEIGMVNAIFEFRELQRAYIPSISEPGAKDPSTTPSHMRPDLWFDQVLIKSTS